MNGLTISISDCSEMTITSCAWCGSQFPPLKLGAHQKRFCSPQCRGLFHTAARQWAELALVRGEISVADLKAPVPSCTTPGAATLTPPLIEQATVEASEPTADPVC